MATGIYGEYRTKKLAQQRANSLRKRKFQGKRIFKKVWIKKQKGNVTNYKVLAKL